ncbi:MAG TPA: helix-turn-helix domain-containing protein, partial [Streptosporangiaceae bacterium]|nr:helix-turn-helix domain-containing protein [Streptosporangiaceae bacterium]
MPGAQKPPEKRPLASPEEVGDYLGGISPDTLKDWRHKHEGPKYIPVGKHVRYDLDDVDAWLDARRVDPRPA